MKNTVAYFLIFLGVICYGQDVAAPAPSYNSVGLKVHLSESVKDPILKSDIKKHLRSNYLGGLKDEPNGSHLSLSFENSYYALTKLPENQVIYKLDNSKPEKTAQLINESISQFANGFKIKKLNLKNTDYQFSFRIKPIYYENGDMGGEIPIENFSQTNGNINFNTNGDAAILEVSNLSDHPIYFSIIEINSRGEISSFVPNVNCALLGSERRIEAGETLTVESCLFQFGPPYETLILKGFASAEPINFNPIIQNEDDASLDFVKDYYTEMFTYQFTYNIVDSNQHMPYDVSIDHYQPKTSPELKSAYSELKVLMSQNDPLNEEYMNKLKEVADLHIALGNDDEAEEFLEQYKKLLRSSFINKEKSDESLKLSGFKKRDEAAEKAKRFARMTDAEKIAFLRKENTEKTLEINALKTEILELKAQLKNQNSNSSFGKGLRGSEPKLIKKNPLSEFTYRALIIAEQDYNDDAIKDLSFPIADAKKLETILTSNYAFDQKNVTFLENPTRKEIFKALHNLYEISSPTDHLLIFYAGHGVYDAGFKRGYWLPSDAEMDNKSSWMSNLDIKDYITNIKTKHTLLISDACFSGSIFEYNRDVTLDQTSPVIKKLLTKNGRNAMTSGLDKPVPDESVFIKYILKALSENIEGYIKASDLFNIIQEVVLSNTDNIPQYGVIKNANHEGGEFIFLKRD
ncbi:caspase family protein [Winogradskyella ursingii]|uniref:caspase family protein n=1 Tax=Winogradskyella ursingii TaxID=2686079 RepID=UPI0015C92751|nr:caspase family protein [Winogradskyella ursingii]